MPILRKPGPFLAVAALTALLLAPICGLLHRCGCRPLWSGGVAECNIHRPQGPHCPWCEHPALGATAAVLVLAGQAGVFVVVRRRATAGAAAVLALLALPPASALAGALLWLPTDYPHFLALEARARLGLPEGPIPCIGKGSTAATARWCHRR